MEYRALYRKYRPNNFSDVIGQKHIIKTLKNQIKTSRISHAYLFCGGRGTGKTSTAKIFAKAINCKNQIDGESCNECSLCISISNNKSTNVIEIDAASNNSVDNIREIKEEIKYPPTEGIFKVYIIDEVHMLSQGAFNALLKTLEEPPSYIVFILATTDPQKIPVTILSRCQRFDFRRISPYDIESVLSKYCEYENIDIEQKALKYISYISDGSVRDSLSILDQCISFFYGEKITTENVVDICGLVDVSIFFDVSNAIFDKNIKALIDITDKIVMQGRNLKQFVIDIIKHFRNLLVVVTVDDLNNIIDMAEYNIEELKKQSEKTSPNELIYLIKAFSSLLNDIKYVNNERILIEVLFIKICSKVVETDIESVLYKISDIEKNINSNVPIPVQNTITKNKDDTKIKENVTFTEHIDKNEDILYLKKIWDNVCEKFEIPLKTVLSKTSLKQKDSNIIYICCKNKINQSIINNNMSIIIDKIKEMTKKDFNISSILESEYNNWHNKTSNNYFENSENEKLCDDIKETINYDIKFFNKM